MKKSIYKPILQNKRLNDSENIMLDVSFNFWQKLGNLPCIITNKYLRSYTLDKPFILNVQ